ncbi:MAG TPA: histone deacetylase [Terriglobales bacterium]|jgi:acetoin utilization deacetylase AcuC-like enzyme|nr:histone deacetylase [Terriglobales bacterium]
MLPFKIVYSDAYYLPIGEHVFPAGKYRLVHQRLLESGLAEPADFIAPHPAEDRDILLVHGADYVYKLQTGTLTAREELQMEIPFSEELVDAFWLAAGGSILAGRCALQDGIGINLGGGFHHAFPDHGEGFCMINDIAVAIRRLQKDKKIERALVIDCDVHQGNGTAVIFGRKRALELAAQPLPSAGAPTLRTTEHGSIRELPADGADVFTISLHQENNYPTWKPPSSIDVNLPDGIGDEPYLGWLDNAVSSALRRFEPQLISYVAGADPYQYDQLGGLQLSVGGLKKRDQFVFRMAKTRGIPVMVTLAGGYALDLNDTITIHSNTVAAAKEVFGS